MEILFGRFSGLFYSAVFTLISASFALHTPILWGVSAIFLLLLVTSLKTKKRQNGSESRRLASWQEYVPTT